MATGLAASTQTRIENAIKCKAEDIRVLAAEVVGIMRDGHYSMLAMNVRRLSTLTAELSHLQGMRDGIIESREGGT